MLRSISSLCRTCFSKRRITPFLHCLSSLRSVSVLYLQTTCGTNIVPIDRNSISARKTPSENSESPCKHPLADFFLGSLDKAVQMERSVLQPVREMADYVIDTSLLAPAQLKKQLASLFLGSAQDALSIHCLSFGFKYGLPPEADLVFDVRCLPNPYYMPELKPLTGLDDPVRNYVMRWEQSQEVKKRLFSLIDYMLPLYVEEGKSQLVVAVGCTGGKHRSVTFAQLLYEHFSAEGKKVSVSHRDIQKR